MIRRYAVIEAPSILGLRPSGVERLPQALMDAGLTERLGARHAGRVDPLPYDDRRDPQTGLLNIEGIARYTPLLAAATTAVLDRGEFPVVLEHVPIACDRDMLQVCRLASRFTLRGDSTASRSALGGDCSIVLGNLLALRRRGRYGLLFIDGHADFYQPEADVNGEAASSDLALATGRGPAALTDFDRDPPLVRDEDVVVLGFRDAEEAASYGSQSLPAAIRRFDLAELRRTGARATADAALAHLARDELEGFWIHLDVDVLDDAIMPAVDYRLPGGLSWDELAAVLCTALASHRAIGLEVTIFNPALDRNGGIAQALVRILADALQQTGVGSRSTVSTA